MKDYVSEFRTKIDEIDADCKNINIINAGIMNHGKSSMFNSLLDKEVFAAQDIRTTMKNQEVQWQDNIFLIDTPGLDAEEADDDFAYNAYRRANMIIFVHNVKVGELHANELEAINKIKSLFNNDDFFCKHFCLALTFKDSDSDDSIISIRNKTLGDIKNHCGISEFKTFIISNSRYKKGMAENKQNMVCHSGIPELRDYLKKNFSTWNNENKYFRGIRISNEKKDMLAKLDQEREKVQQNINKKTNDIKNRQKNFLYKIETAVNQRREDESRYDQERSMLNSMKSNLSNLRDRWNRERY